MRRVLKVLVVLTLAGGGATVAVPSALAYTVGSGCTGNAPATVAGGQPFTFSVTCKQSNGQPIPAGTKITFSQTSGPTAAVRHADADMQLVAYVQPQVNAATTCVASFNPVTASADASGSASTTVTLPPGCPGSYVLTATAATGGSVSVTVTEVGGASGSGFPNTAANQPGSAGTSGWLVLVAAAVLISVIVVGGTFFLKARRSH
jgi:hypothetical protein